MYVPIIPAVIVCVRIKQWRMLFLSLIKQITDQFVLILIVRNPTTSFECCATDGRSDCYGARCGRCGRSLWVRAESDIVGDISSALIFFHLVHTPLMVKPVRLPFFLENTCTSVVVELIVICDMTVAVRDLETTVLVLA